MALSKNVKNFSVFLLALGICGVPVLFYLAPDPFDDSRIGLVLRLTARLALVVYVVVFVSRPLRQLLPNRFTTSLLRNRPYIGLALASVMTVHLALIGWRFIFVLGERPGWVELVAGGIAYTLLYLMAITTFPAPARALGWRNWGRLHRTGLYWIGGIFAASLIPDVIAMPAEPVYLATGILIIGAVAIRASAFLKQRPQRTAATDSAR